MTTKLFSQLTIIFLTLALLFIVAVLFWPELFVTLSSDILSLLGVHAESSKVIEFLGIPDVQYPLLLLITVLGISLTNYRVVTGRHHKLRMLMITAVLLLMMNLFIDSVWCRRILFALLYGPLTIYFALDFVRFLKENCQEKVMRCFLISTTFLVAGIFIIPGFYLPPFFDGIAGWYLKAPSDRYTISDIRIKYKDQHTEWFRSSFFNPITMAGRPYKSLLKRDKKFVKSPEFGCFLALLYNKAYPSLKKGILPTQSIIGRLAYPPHTYDKFPDKSDYPAVEQIASFELVTVNFDDGVRTEKVLSSWGYDHHLCGREHKSLPINIYSEATAL